MDEKKLAELFNDAVRDAPPATFGTGDVRQASHRARVKRRNAVVAGSALAFVLLAGGTLTTVALSGGMKDTTAANAPVLAGGGPGNGGTMYNEGNAEQVPPSPGVRQHTPQLDSRTEPPKQGGAAPSGNAGTAGSTPSGCQADRGLAAALAGELPAASQKTEVAVPFGCPSGARGAAYQITDGTRTGTISIVLLPPGVMSVAPLGSDVYGTANAESATRGGGVLHIVSQPTPGIEPAEAPLVDEIARYAARIAPNL